MLEITIKLLKYSVLCIIGFLCNQANGKEIVMAFSQDIPPYIMEKNNTGIEIDIISSALAYKGHTLKPLYYPLGRVPLAYQNNLVDAAMGDMGVELKGAFYGNPAVIYDNVFITLKSRGIVINKPRDLNSLFVASFQGAEKRYAHWLENVVKEKRFFGVSDQLKQVKLLHMGRFDVVLSDRYIFKYFVNQIKLIDDLDISDIDEHQFITVNPLDYRPVFRDEKIRDDFNVGLNYLKENGEFEKIYNKYLNL